MRARNEKEHCGIQSTADAQSIPSGLSRSRSHRPSPQCSGGLRRRLFFTAVIALTAPTAHPPRYLQYPSVAIRDGRASPCPRDRACVGQLAPNTTPSTRKQFVFPRHIYIYIYICFLHWRGPVRSHRRATPLVGWRDRSRLARSNSDDRQWLIRDRRWLRY